MSAVHIKGSRQAVLMLHGFTGTPQQLETYAKSMAQKFGWEVYVPLLPGHGTSPQDLATIRSETWLQACNEALETLCHTYGSVHIMGLSMGALLSVALFHQHPDRIKSMVLMAPALSLYDRYKNYLFKLLAYLPRLPFNFMIPKKLEEGMGPTYRVYPFSAVQQLSKLAHRVIRSLPLSCPPYLIAYSTKDTTIGLNDGKNLCRGLLNPGHKLLQLEESHHILPMAKDRLKLLHEIFDFYEALEG